MLERNIDYEYMSQLQNLHSLYMRYRKMNKIVQSDSFVPVHELEHIALDDGSEDKYFSRDIKIVELIQTHYHELNKMVGEISGKILSYLNFILQVCTYIPTFAFIFEIINSNLDPKSRHAVTADFTMKTNIYRLGTSL